MKLAFGEFQLWYQLALSMAASGKVRPKPIYIYINNNASVMKAFSLFKLSPPKQKVI